MGVLRNAQDDTYLTILHSHPAYKKVTGQAQFVIAGLTRNLRRILVRLRLGGRNDGLLSDW